MDNENWLSDKPIQDWYGVTTTSSGRITALGLRGNLLSGEIPAEIGNLADLVSLDLYDNQLSGEIPPELGNLADLVWVSLGRNQLTARFPSN